MGKINTFSFHLFVVVIFFGCKNDPFLDTSRDTYHDSICDIAVLNGQFYSTNYDLSTHAGSQIDLFRFSTQDSIIVLTDRYELGLNGQGYLAMTSDMEKLYLQSNQTDLILAISAVGEEIFLTADTVGSVWHPSGIAYLADSDSLALLYRNGQFPQRYRLRVVSKLINPSASRDVEFEYTFMDSGDYGLYAMTYQDSQFYFLGVDQAQQDVLLTTGWGFTPVSVETIPDSTVTGLCFKEDDLYFSYGNRSIKKVN